MCLGGNLREGPAHRLKGDIYDMKTDVTGFRKYQKVHQISLNTGKIREEQKVPGKKMCPQILFINQECDSIFIRRYMDSYNLIFEKLT